MCVVITGTSSNHVNFNRALDVVRTIRQRFRSDSCGDAFEEHRRNFSPYCGGSKKRQVPSSSQSGAKRNKVGQWTGKYMCLSSKDATNVPTTVGVKEMLVEAGLGEKKIEVPDVDCTAQEFHEILFNAYPRLRNGGGFELLRCLPNTRRLEPISVSIAKSPKMLRQVVGASKIYIRPIQRDLDITPVADHFPSQEVRYSPVCTNFCFYCYFCLSLCR